MNIYRKIFSGSVILMSAILATSCNQSSDVSTSNLDSSGSDAIEVANPYTGAYVALSNTNMNVYEGGTFSLDITVNDFEVSEGGSVTLRYDPSLLQVTTVTVDNSVWDFVNKDGLINNSTGTVTDILFSSYQGVSGNAKVATVEFKSISKGEGEIIIEASSANPFASNGEEMNVSFVSTTVVSN